MHVVLSLYYAPWHNGLIINSIFLLWTKTDKPIGSSSKGLQQKSSRWHNYGNSKIFWLRYVWRCRISEADDICEIQETDPIICKWTRSRNSSDNSNEKIVLQAQQGRGWEKNPQHKIWTCNQWLWIGVEMKTTSSKTFIFQQPGNKFKFWHRWIQFSFLGISGLCQQWHNQKSVWWNQQICNTANK
jgi:hypothetical protein